MQPQHSYTQADLEYVKKNILILSFQRMAQHVGVTSYALKKKITDWRKAGHPIPKRANRIPMEIGTVKSWKGNSGERRIMEKTVNGWRPVKQLESKPVNRTMVKRPPVASKKKKASVNTAYIKPRRTEAKHFTTRRQDLSTKKSLFIPELRMTVFVDAGSDVAQIREKYLSKRIAI